ncbi:Eco57I restriction-modification methylase domain-containing protein [Dehalococcoides mccartyi]|uniref:Eco57I restriction-modification methylase domain-containing protein n=1 Tax=Dehalococcoides mccartyi TaxID=61435 RepID=UPI001AF8A95C|nr:TaqI-like C-terminal specificity domain-containing protein [Dehalococcoides mccartyi]BCT55303.1 putative type IIS restriction /modification enzyme, N-terminal half [Dehalococcoides mccartyi]
MDRNTATRIVKDTFERPFDKEHFVNLCKNLFKTLDYSKNFTYQGNIIPDAYEQSIQTLERIGKFEDTDNNKIDLLIVRLKKERSLEHARTMQRNFVAWYLNGSRGGELKDAALVAFVSPESQDWRFSLVRMDYNIAQSPSGRIKVEKELTPARRYSFLVGENESSHTAQVQLLPILQDDERKPLLSDFEKAFNIEVVTREFFTKYRELFHNVEEALEGMIKQNAKAREDFEAKSIDQVNFAKKLLGQIVFLYFLQKKGWFGVGRDADWGTGPKDFLQRLFEKKIASYGNFFNDVLEPLFYEALAVERTDDFYSRFNCKIPFLNGGLFDPINNYDWVHTDILLPNKLFSNDEKTKEGDTGTGILDVFDRYNFTVKEDEPLDKEVAVDPEMLGKVFENLLEVKDRKSKGTYYTPREIVHYMCQESLINYLDTALNTGDVPLVVTAPPQGKLFGKPDPEQGALKVPGYRAIVPREDTEAFIRMGELAIEHDTRVESYGKETERYSYKLPESIRQNAKLIDERLASIRVCDPAIGSGAFPVGLMTEIVRARNTLTTYLPDKKGRTNYNFKRHAIQNCLYGVDIDAGAVEIAKLRLWLSLVVDEEDIKQIQPLPNLDYKVVCGNSLLSVEKNLFNVELFNELEKLKLLYFNETNIKKKQEFRKQIDQLIKKLTNNKEVFDFEVYFSEVFHEKGGFDVAIANPPYVSFGLHNSKNATKEWANLVRKLYPGSAEYKISLYALFIDIAIRISRKGGVVCYITPDSFLLGRYFSKLRKTLLDNASVSRLVMFEKDFWKSGVVGRPTISLYQKGIKGQLTTAIFAEDEQALTSNNFLEYSYPQEYFRNAPYNRFRLFFAPIAKRFVETVESKSKPLSSVAHITTGVRSKTNQDKVVSMACLGPTWKKGIVSGGQVRRYCVEWKGHFLNIDGNLLFSGGWDKNIVENPKIMIRQTGDSIIAGIDLSNLYHLNNVHSLHLTSTNVSLSYICALLNSRLMNRYYHLISLEYKRTMAQTDIETLELLPYREPDREILQRIDSLFLRIDDIDSQNEIERILERVYGLDQELVGYLTGEDFYPEK